MNVSGYINVDGSGFIMADGGYTDSSGYTRWDGGYETMSGDAGWVTVDGAWIDVNG